MKTPLRVRALRDLRNLTQRQVAKALGVSPGAVAKWELGVSMPTMENLLALATLFGCTTDALLGREPPGAEQAS